MKIRPLTEEEKALWPKEVIVALEKAHTDERGSIQPLVDLTMEIPQEQIDAITIFTEENQNIIFVEVTKA